MGNNWKTNYHMLCIISLGFMFKNEGVRMGYSWIVKGIILKVPQKGDVDEGGGKYLRCWFTQCAKKMIHLFHRMFMAMKDGGVKVMGLCVKKQQNM